MVVTRKKNWRWEELDNSNIELSLLARHFELYNRTEGKSPKTIDWYNLALRQFQRFLVKSERSINLNGLGEAEVRGFILYLQERKRWQENPYVLNQQGKLAAISIQTYIRALRAFFNWLYKEGYTGENRLARLKPPKAPTRVVEILTQEEIARVLGCIDQNSASGARNYTILMLLLDTGLRCSEMRNMELQDVNIEGGYVKVMGKGGKERIVPFGASVQKALLRYLLHFRPEPFGLSILNFFLTMDGMPMTKNSIKR
jgi:site-specific recombinase XerD